MFAFLQRQKLVKRGFASEKLRRRRTDREWLDAMEHGTPARVALCALFVVLLALILFSWFEREKEPTERFLMVMLIFVTAVGELWLNYRETWSRNSRLMIVFATCLVHLFLVKLFLVAAHPLQSSTRTTILDGSVGDPAALYHLAVPMALAPMLLSTLLGKQHGIFAATFCSLWGCMIHQEVRQDFLVMSLISGFVAVFVTVDVRRPSQLIRAGLFIGTATVLMGLLLGKIGPWSVLAYAPAEQRMEVVWQLLIAAGSPVLTSILLAGALPMIESVTRITTPISWVLLADLNHPLLKRMSLEAPGTFQHSLAVASLAETACETIGANAAMARVCAYFHDIGKLVKPDYFVENMRHDRNPHDELTPTMSALVIMAHVKEGVALALEHNLKPEIIDVIQQHHGTSLVVFFYRRAVELLEKARNERAATQCKNPNHRHDADDDFPDVSEQSFRYGGPKPQTRESAIVSLADSVESASRSMEKVTPQRIEQMVTDIFDKRLLDGQLRECELTLRELDDVAESFKRSLASMMHARIAYPDDPVSRHRSSERETPHAPTKSGSRSNVPT
jgi:putative nucleotidyltransferase with HDIG domain